MSVVQKYFNLWEMEASQIKDIAFLKILIPVLAITGPAVCFIFGIKGIIKKETIILFRRRNMLIGSPEKISGIEAIIFGIFYIIVGILFIIILVSFAWKLLF